MPNEVPVDVQKLGIQALLDPSVKKIAIANPAHAPYGRAAEAALRQLGIYDQVSRRNSFWEKTFRKPRSLSNRAMPRLGLIAPCPTLLRPHLKDKGHYWIVPLDAYPTLNQAAVVLSKSKQQNAARKFLDFIRSPEGTSLLTGYGFSLPVPGGTPK